MGDLVTKYGANPSPMDQTLAEFIFPGTSNSGSYGTKLLPACDSCRKEPLKFYTDTPLLGIVAGLFLQDWAITQTANIEGQLSLGARVLDLRFFRVTPADNQYMQGFVDLLISLGIGDIIALPATDGYYTHNTFAGPSSTEIFEHVRNFLVDGTGVPIPGREREIIILNFSEMLKGNGEMTADDLNAIFDQLISTVGIQTFAESSLTDSAMLATLQAAGKQIIVSYDGNVPVAALDPAIRPYIWPKIVAQGFDDFNPPGTSFPRADTWNTEGRLFGEMEMLALERVNLDATSQLFQMNVSMGADDASDFPDMITRRLLCNLPTVYSDVSAYYDPLELLTDLLGIKSPPAGTTDPTEFEQLIETLLGTVKDSINGALGLAAFEAFMDDVLGICPAINDDWDRFTSLEEVAGFTNPKLLPSLVGLPRDTVNIVLVDHYPGEFTDEANKLNQGATRVSVVITKVEERECHDCVPFTALRLSNPDYYPEITFFPKNVSGSIVPDVWGYYKSPVDVVEANTPEFGVFQEAILLPNLTEAGQTEHESHWGGPWLESSATRVAP
ncbi:MAG: hypothetical protein OEM51_09935, partial [Gammaproteobacteria bacterium]|nr:hypothetical protein [Gammaproteobacteria bacterium]